MAVHWHQLPDGKTRISLGEYLRHTITDAEYKLTLARAA